LYLSIFLFIFWVTLGCIRFSCYS